MAVVDYHNRCLTGFNVRTGDSVGRILGDLSDPRDVEAYGGGWLVPNCNSNSVTWVAPDGVTQSVLDVTEPLSVATVPGPDPGSTVLTVRSKHGVALFRLMQVVVAS